MTSMATTSTCVFIGFCRLTTFVERDGSAKRRYVLTAAANATGMESSQAHYADTTAAVASDVLCSTVPVLQPADGNEQTHKQRADRSRTPAAARHEINALTRP